MADLGSTGSRTQILAKAIRTGVVTLIITDLTKSVTFASAMPSANYRVFLQVEENAAVAMWATGKGTSGFTLNLSAGLAGTVAYMAVED